MTNYENTWLTIKTRVKDNKFTEETIVNFILFLFGFEDKEEDDNKNNNIENINSKRLTNIDKLYRRKKIKSIT